MTYSAVARKYCEDVMAGAIPAGRLVQLACKRHLTDLELQADPAYPYRYDAKLGNRRCAFSENFPHVKGKWAGTTLTLSPHQVFIECALWGWVRKKDGKRRFRIAYVEIPRKNGKSVQGALTGLYGLAADAEKGAEIYSGATTEKQALEVFRPAWQMAHKSADFRDYYTVSLSGTPKNPTSIYRVSDMSRFELIVGKPGDGASPHYAIIDEYHEHATSDQYDTMETGMGAREQPLMFVITTAGSDTSGPCYDMHLRAIKVLEGTIEDDAFFGIIWGIDQSDDYRDFEVWKKANPNYGVSIQEDYLQRKYRETLTDASKQNVNLCKHLNVWTNAGVAWMNMTKWAACADPTLRLSDFQGQPCWVGVDLASKIDLCALVQLFAWGERGYAMFARYYLPEETVQLAGNDHYGKWAKEGRIIQTGGARTDFLAIETDLKALHAATPICQIAYDPREATYLMNNVMSWLERDPEKPEVVIEVNQGPTLMSEPMKELEALIYARRIWFDGDPVFTWMMANVVKKQGRVGGPVKYYYPTKEKAENKIDGPVALIMAVGRAMLKQGMKPSIYEQRGLVTL